MRTLAQAGVKATIKTTTNIPKLLARRRIAQTSDKFAARRDAAEAAS